jgi:hypothetical protein
MSGLPENMDCSLLGSDNKEGTVPMAVVPFSNRMYIYIISSSLFAIFSAIVFYVFFKPQPIVKDKQTLSQITFTIAAIIGITSVVFYNLYNNTPATFNFLFFGMIGIILTFCLIAYLIITDKDYLMGVINEIGIICITVIITLLGSISIGAVSIVALILLIILLCIAIVLNILHSIINFIYKISEILYNKFANNTWTTSEKIRWSAFVNLINSLKTVIYSTIDFFKGIFSWINTAVQKIYTQITARNNSNTTNTSSFNFTTSITNALSSIFKSIGELVELILSGFRVIGSFVGDS